MKTRCHEFCSRTPLRSLLLTWYRMTVRSYTTTLSNIIGNIPYPVLLLVYGNMSKITCKTPFFLVCGCKGTTTFRTDQIFLTLFSKKLSKRHIKRDGNARNVPLYLFKYTCAHTRKKYHQSGLLMHYSFSSISLIVGIVPSTLAGYIFSSSYSEIPIG